MNSYSQQLHSHEDSFIEPFEFREILSYLIPAIRPKPELVRYLIYYKYFLETPLIR